MILGDLFDHIDTLLDKNAPAMIEEGPQGTLRIVTANERKRWSNNLARAMLNLGAEPGDKVAIYTRNRFEYPLATIAAIKARLVHVNVNYRYRDDELLFVIDNSDAKVVIYEADYADNVARIRHRSTKVRAFIEIGDTPQTINRWASSFNDLINQGGGEPLGIVRSPEDLFFVYTGGTTGLPKGVMWELYQLWNMIGYDYSRPDLNVVPQAPAEVNPPPAGGSNKTLIIVPFMHGSGIYAALNASGYGNTLIILRALGFDADLTLRAIDKYGVTAMTIAGDVFAKPMIRAIEANPGRYKLDCFKALTSSAMTFSAENKRKFLEYCPHLIIADIVGSSETPRTAMSVVSKQSDVQKACESLQLFPAARVFTEDFAEVLPGNGGKGFLAVSGTLPLGYYKDAKKTAETFFLLDGVRYSRPGDWVEVLEDGKVKFLGRGNVSINTGGEKVYPDEVESVIKSYPGIEDCLVVGVPDAHWGQAITVVVECSTGCLIDPEQIRNHVRTRIADYKVPKYVLFVEKLYRSPSGKADYPATQKFALGAVSEKNASAI